MIHKHRNLIVHFCGRFVALQEGYSLILLYCRKSQHHCQQLLMQTTRNIDLHLLPPQMLLKPLNSSSILFLVPYSNILFFLGFWVPSRSGTEIQDLSVNMSRKKCHRKLFKCPCCNLWVIYIGSIHQQFFNTSSTNA